MFRNALAVIAVSLLAALVTPPALAVVDCEARPNHRQCVGVSPTPIAPSIVIRDSNDVVVGITPVRLQRVYAGALIHLIVLETDVAGELRTFAAEVTQTGFQSGSDGTQDFVWSEDKLCGEPLFKVQDILFGLERAFVSGGIAYITQNPNAAPIGVTVESSLHSFTGQCTQESKNVRSGVLPTHSTDIESEFGNTFSFTLEYEK